MVVYHLYTDNVVVHSILPVFTLSRLHYEQSGSSRVRKRRLSLVQAAATSPKKMKLSEEELGKMEESISRQKQLDDEGESESNLSDMEIGEK